MANTSSRTLRLLSLLQTHRYWPGAELAERLEVSPRTVRRDVDRLRELGYPVQAHRGIDGGYQLAAGAVLPPLVLDDDEAVALAIGLRMAAQGTVAGIEESSLRALTKVVQVMPPRLRRRAEVLLAATVPAPWGPGPRADAAVLTAVAQACRDEERLRFSYTAHKGERSDRYVEPHRLVSLGRRWYLVAYDVNRHDWRSFRLDRLNGPVGTGERFRPRELPAEDAAAFVRRSLGSFASASHSVEVVVRAPAAAVRGAVGSWATVTEIDETSCRLLMSSDSLDWPAMALGTLRADFEVVRPPELVDHLRDWAARFTRSTTA
ncbi:helix-turn-helix transcriptional regulator [Sphaerisporangium dianthi]|uniref:Helix-turn-helix transcriptional regulator n=1 Tax=Sphaerisporangium dianthi TaxID=1436120 RepID=A0ABV9CKA9_9ACTN